MKTTYLLAIVGIFNAVARSVASANWRSTQATGADVTYISPTEAFELTNDWPSAPVADVIDVNPAEALALRRGFPRDSLLEVSQGDRAVAQRRLLLAKLHSEEREAAQERVVLQTQQKFLMAIEQGQQAMEARAAALELSEASTSSGRVVVDRGTIGNAIGPKAHSFAKSRVATMINVTETESQYWSRNNKKFATTVTGICFYVVTMLVVGFIYIHLISKSPGPKLPDSMVRTDEFQFGAFECGELDKDWYICLCSWCCEWVRWADTASNPQIDLLAFWPALFITALLSATAAISFGLTIPILFLLVLYCRQRIRMAYGLPTGTCSVLAWDCCLWMCCPCCAIVQEARQVEYVESGLVPYYENMPDGYDGSSREQSRA